MIAWTADRVRSLKVRRVDAHRLAEIHPGLLRYCCGEEIPAVVAEYVFSADVCVLEGVNDRVDELGVVRAQLAAPAVFAKLKGHGWLGRAWAVSFPLRGIAC